MNRVCAWAIILAIVAIGAGIGMYTISRMHGGFSTRDRPGVIEALIARRARRWAIPARAKNLKNPIPATPDMVLHGRNHWADHCASCHANNGSGDTEIGRSLYQPAPDMRQRDTHSLSDGELYAIIRNGVRFTGMPAWRKPEDGDSDSETWMLVLFVRHLPHLTPEEEGAMQKLNPKSAAEREEEQQEEDFLNGKTP